MSNCTCNNGYLPMPGDPTTMMRCPHCAQNVKRVINTNVTLAPDAWEASASFAIKRHRASMGSALTNIVKNKNFSPLMEMNQVGGVYAAAVALNEKPKLSIGTGEPDMVGPYRVRTSSLPKAKLRVTNEPDSQKIVQVVGRYRTYRITGWITAGEARRIGQRERLNNSEAECYTVPQSLLHPITELK
jgi:hypothetical protein